MEPSESMDSWGGFHIGPQGARPLNLGAYEVAIAVDSRNFLASMVHQVSTTRQRFTAEAQRELVRYRLRAHFDIVVGAMNLEENEADYRYTRNMVRENILRAPQVQVPNGAAPNIAVPIPIPIAGIYAGANLPDLFLHSESVNSTNYPPPLNETPAIPHR